MCDLLWSDPEGISLLQMINHVINLALWSLVDNKGNVLLDHWQSATVSIDTNLILKLLIDWLIEHSFVTTSMGSIWFDKWKEHED